MPYAIFPVAADAFGAIKMTTPPLTSTAVTDTGRMRSHNEDCVHADPARGLFVVADGMGGHKAGEVASALAIVRMREIIEKALPGTPDTTAETAGQLLQQAVEAANHAIFEAAESDPRYSNMGTTLVASLITNQHIYVAHVGDSRLYRFREQRLERITNDHSLVQEMIDQGFYTPEQASRANNRNIVTRAMGLEPDVNVELQQHPLEQGDLYLLCSDGLSDMLDEDTIALTLHQFGDNLSEAAQYLVAAANEAGGRDNISVVLALTGDADRDKH